MDNLVVNAVAPWQGYLHWLGNIREGNGKNGPWAFADFTLKYSDHKMQEKYITFTIGDAEKVEMLKNTPIGTPLKVGWVPDATENTQAERWYPTNRAYNVNVIEGIVRPEKPKAEKITAPNFPEQPNTAYAPIPKTSYPQPIPPLPPMPDYTPSDNDLPFDESPGV